MITPTTCLSRFIKFDLLLLTLITKPTADETPFLFIADSETMF